MTAPPVVFLVDVDNTLLVTTIFPRQGQYARDASAYRPADVTVERIADLLTHDFAELPSPEVTR